MGGKKGENKINQEFVKEYQSFLNDYLLRLLGFVGKNIIRDEVYKSGNTKLIDQDDYAITFSVGHWKLFELSTDNGANKLSDDNLALATCVIKEFLIISEYKWNGGKQNGAYPFANAHGAPEVYKDRVYNMAIQKGICSWVVGQSSYGNIDRMFHILETWAVKTYEGKRVTLGIIIDPEAKSLFDSTYGDFLDFLEDDAAAVLTDSIHSAVELDANCNFVRHISVSEKDTFPSCELNHRIPLRFTQLIQQHVVGKKVGIFLLNNGDIILAKKQSLYFVKRNLQWLNFSYEAFCVALEPFVNNNKNTQDVLIKSIFASILDVSFSHTGGIVAIIGKPWDATKNPIESLTEEVLSGYDNLMRRKTLKELASNPDLSEAERKKRVLKRNAILSLTKGKKFQNIDRKLRSELMALDGSCIMSCTGAVYAFGAIIQNDSGSAGGSRSAAAKKLSAYGVAVKISTDGYIEVYINEEAVYAIK